MHIYQTHSRYDRLTNMSAAAHILYMLAAAMFIAALAAWCEERVSCLVSNGRRIPGGVRLALSCLAAMLAVYAGSKTNSPPRSAPGGGVPRFREPTGPVTAEEITLGYRLANVVTNDGMSYAMPSNGVEYMRWSLRGGRETRFALDFGNFVFPFGTGFVGRVDVLSGGMVESFPRPSLAVVCAVSEWASLVPDESRFWSADLDGGAAKLLTWENVFAGRDSDGCYSAQIELRADGDFTTRSNNVERVYRRVAPFDWDGDGLENSIDPDPLVAGPDAHGTNAEWLNVACSNVLSAADGPGGPVVSWLEGVNSNAYYFVDVVAKRGVSPIRFTGDRPSRLGDPVVVARSGETNHVPLLIGIGYAVTSDVPFSVSFPEDYMYPAVETNEPCVAHILWPLEFEFAECITPTNRIYTVEVQPFDPGGIFSWEERGEPPAGGLRGGCSCVSFAGRDIVFNCSGGCDGNCTADGTFNLEGALFAVTGGVCRCGFDDPQDEEPPSYDPEDGPAFSIAFSKRAVIFEDAYEDGPGTLKPKRSTRVCLTVSAYGGSHGGSFTLTSQNLDKLYAVGGGEINLPASMTLSAGQSFHTSCIYEGQTASDSADDVSVSGRFTESGTGLQIPSSNLITVVRVELTEVAEALLAPYIHRRTYGIGEKIKCSHEPSSTIVKWVTTGTGDFVDDNGKMFKCGMDGGQCEIAVSYSDVSLWFPISVLTPQAIVCDYVEFIPPTAQDADCGMLLHLSVSPFTVSFSGLKIEEIPGKLENWSQWGSHSGYFADMAYYFYWCHTTQWGAGVWMSITESNAIGMDRSMIRNWIPPWSAGTLSWTIPYGWKQCESDSNESVGQISPPSYSVWTMTSNMIEKTKHGHKVSITSSGNMYLDGVQQNEN